MAICCVPRIAALFKMCLRVNLCVRQLEFRCLGPTSVTVGKYVRNCHNYGCVVVCSVMGRVWEMIKSGLLISGWGREGGTKQRCARMIAGGPRAGRVTGCGMV